MLHLILLVLARIEILNALFKLVLRLAKGKFRFVTIGERDIGSAFERENAERRQEANSVIMGRNNGKNTVIQALDLFFIEWHAHHEIVLAPMPREAHAVRLQIAQNVADLAKQRVALPLSIPIVKNAHMAQIDGYHAALIIGVVHRIIVRTAQEVVDARQARKRIGAMGRLRLERCDARGRNSLFRCLRGMFCNLGDTTIQIIGHHRGTHCNTRISCNCHRSRKQNIHAAHAHGLGHKVENIVRPALQVAAIVAVEHKHVLQAV